MTQSTKRLAKVGQSVIKDNLELQTVAFSISRPYDFRVLKNGTIIINRWRFKRVGIEITKTWRFKLK